MNPKSQIPNPESPKHQGFTLIELSIVLVIIGLIVGGVLVGQDLVEVAKRRQVLTEIEKFQATVLTFKLKYNGLPGDLSNASTFFSGHGNGNGDKRIWGSGSNFANGSGPLALEPCHVFAHLSAADLIKLEVSPCANNDTYLEKAPKLPFNQKTHYAVSSDCMVVACTNPPGPKGGPHYWFTIGANVSYSERQFRAFHHATSQEHPFTVEDVRWFDIKVDDGQARSGRVALSRGSGAQPSWTLAGDSDFCIDNGVGDEFKTSETRRLCQMRMVMNF